MKIITVLIGDVLTFPPVISLLHALEKIGFESIFITTRPSKELNFLLHTKIEILNINYESINSPIKKLINMKIISNLIWKYIDSYYDNKSIIWVVTDVTIKYLGKRLYERQYILHLLELSENILYYHKFPFLKMDKEKLGNNAKAVVVPEYNRAHLIKTWWKLKNLPYVLPNKPFYPCIIKRNSPIDDLKANQIMNKIGMKKILLYQGVISPERPLDMFIKAVDEYHGEYAFVVMSGGKNLYEDYGSSNYYFIPFISPPNHLQVTSHAYIGILSYIPSDTTGYSPLNSLYCAPNKTFEYSMFGIPMLGNDIPGLKYLFELNKCGKCFNDFEKQDICNAIDAVSNNYEYLSKNSLKYYFSCDYVALLEMIFKDIV